MANTKSSLTFQNTQTYPSNTSGSITALAVKSFNNNFINAVATLGDTNVFTEPQIFGNTVQVNSDVTANNFIGPLIGTASWAVNALTASNSSTAASSSFAVSASYALSASYAQTSVTASHAVNADLLDGKDSSVFATTGSNTFNGTNTFTGSLNAQSASITFLTVDTIISSSTINNSGSNQLGDAANDTQTLWGTVNLPSGPLKVTGSVSSTGGFTGSLQGTSSWANNATNAISASYALNAVTASFLLGTVANAVSASYASSSTSASYASNGFPFTGSAQISGALTITNNTDGVLLDFKQPSHTTESILSFRMGNQADVTQSISVGSNYLFSGSFNNTYRIVIPTTIDNATLTGSLFGTASYAVQALSASWAPFVATPTSSLLTTASVSLNTITFTKGDGSTFPITVNTGSGGGGGGMNLGANTFTGSQTLASSSIILNASGTLNLANNVTESVSATVGFGNIILNTRSNAAASGSVIISGSGNIVNYSGVSVANPSGYVGNSNIGIVPIYSGSILPNYNTNVAPSAMTVSASSPITIAANWIAGGNPLYTTATTATSSFSFNILNGNSIRVTASLSGSSAGTSVGVANNNFGGANHLIIFEGSSSVARNFQNNIIAGTNNTASLTSAAGVVITTGSLQNSFILGSNLIMSGTMLNTSLSSSTFVGQYNELTATYAPADPSTVRFAVGTGTSAAARRTSFQVFGTGEVVISAAGGGISSRGHTQYSQSAAQIVNSTINAATTVQQYNGSFVSNGGSVSGFTNAIVAGETNTISAGRSSATIGASGNTINTNSGGTDTNNIIAGANTSTISGSTSRFTGIFASTGSSINESINSAIIAGNVNTRLSNVTGSVALSRDAAYTGSANYTLYTQNVNLSGSLTVNGNLQYNFGEFWSSASVTPTAGVSQSVVFDSTGMSSGIAISGSGALIKVTNAGTYNIQFSTQVNTSAGSDTFWMWFKKNGVNIASSNSKLVLANNTGQLMTVNILDNAAANDYYEIAYQSNSGNAQILSEAASGNLPAIPSVILTVTQVK